MSEDVRFESGQFEGIVVRSPLVSPARLADVLHKRFAGTESYFGGEPAVLDFSEVSDWPEQVDWSGLVAFFRRLGLQPIGVRGVPESFDAALKRLHLAQLDATALRLEAVRRAEPAKTAPAAAPETPAPPPADTPRAAAPTKFIDRPVRSGQQIYAPEGDVVLMAGSNPGAEIIAAGSIHCWGPLRGRVLAGAGGNLQARIVATHFGPELVSIAGIYQTFENGLPPSIANRAVQVKLQIIQGQSHLLIEPIDTI
ncbi:septum site-determining protein MinC [Tepidiphilus margaritifer]|uniref:septum site-determining protein MinC n=1 Tax=Tepidiphilus margaritifer TaxID=203471 RepID=UPI0003F53768|nr:septum site-determining protein MinC [Tepidiphilus margaritifer]